jgi:hypothetical protein
MTPIRWLVRGAAPRGCRGPACAWCRRRVYPVGYRWAMRLVRLDRQRNYVIPIEAPSHMSSRPSAGGASGELALSERSESKGICTWRSAAKYRSLDYAPLQGAPLGMTCCAVASVGMALCCAAMYCAEYCADPRQRTTRCLTSVSATAIFWSLPDSLAVGPSATDEGDLRSGARFLLKCISLLHFFAPSPNLLPRLGCTLHGILACRRSAPWVPRRRTSSRSRTRVPVAM